MVKNKDKNTLEGADEQEFIATQKEKQERKDAEWEIEKSNGKNSQKKNGKSLIIKLFCSLVVLALLGAGGFFGYGYFTDEARFKDRKLEKVSLSKDVLEYTFHREIGIYKGISGINDEILLIEREIIRLDEIQKEYPKQKKITELEKKYWTKIKKDLTKVLDKLESKIEQLYVLHLANPEKGEGAMVKEAKALTATIDKALETSREKTERLNSSSAGKGFPGKFKQLKEKIF